MSADNDSLQGDFIDEVIAEWRREMPDLDMRGLSAGGRIFVLHRHLERRVDRFLADYDLQIWGFDVLVSLLRSGPPYTQTPTQLMRNCFLSSGAVTNRLKRLEKRGLVSRRKALDDRRSITVTLTEEGRRLSVEAMRGRVAFMQPVFSVFTEEEQRDFVRLARKLLLHVEELEEWS